MIGGPGVGRERIRSGRLAVIERATAIDMMELAAGTTPAEGQIGAVLISAAGHALELDRVRSRLDARIPGVPRLRQLLQATPFGCGRPIWVDDARFDVANHVEEMRCPPPGDRSAVLAVAAELMAQALPRDRPPWAATLVTGLADGAAALVLRFHHVMADGMGGLAVLANLVDGSTTPTTGGDFPRPAPRPAQLLADAMRSRIGTLAHPTRSLRRARDAIAELGTRPPRAAQCSLNRPVGPRRRLDVASVRLDAFHAAARRHQASVNDAALAAITGAMASFLRDRGESVEHLVVSIPIATRTAAAATRLGNEIGVVPVALPVGGSIVDRIVATAAVTRSCKESARGGSAALLAPLFRLLAAVGLFRWFTDHQRMVNTFVTNLRGPTSPVGFLGAPIEEVIPVNSTSGNVQVAFGVFSYAGTLTITAVADAAMASELSRLVDVLQAQLDAVVASAPAG